VTTHQPAALDPRHWESWGEAFKPDWLRSEVRALESKRTRTDVEQAKLTGYRAALRALDGAKEGAE
jgi:hypothetical protein